jgi:hypothetical protein
MAINVHPTGVFPDWASDNTSSAGINLVAPGVYLPFTNIGDSFTYADSQTHTNGDYRKFLWGILEQTYAHYDSLDSDDKPKKFSIARGNLSIVDEDTAKRTFTVTFHYDIDGFDIDGE